MGRATHPDLLAKRAYTFLHSEDFAGKAATGLLGVIGQFGQPAVFGGLLRDLCLHRPEEFSSDIDLVVATSSWPLLQRRLLSFDAERTRYDGVRLYHEGWQFDVWALDETWALKNSLVQGSSFQDLVRTTFFNWDAIAYEIGTSRLHFLPSYFEEINSRFLEVNLEENANPSGNLIRAIRFALDEHAHWGPRMKAYVLRGLSHFELPESDQAALDKLLPTKERLRLVQRLGNEVGARAEPPL